MMVADSAPSMATARSWPRGFAGFALVSLGLIALSGLAVSLVFRGPGEPTAVLISAVVALVSQLAAFPVVRRLTAKNLIVGWATGSLVRFGTLAVYGLVAGAVLHLPMAPALVSLALFYFLSMVIEPLFLRS